MERQERYYTRGYIPHWDKPGATQFVTWRLSDSLPDGVLRRIEKECPASNPELRRRLWMKIDEELDKGFGRCILRDHRAAAACKTHLYSMHEKTMVLHAFALMPNHVHVLVTPDPSLSLGDFMKKLKGGSSLAINRAIGESGRLWQPDYFDRLIRDDDHFDKTLKYIEWNPVKANLCVDPKHFHHSSAHPECQELLTLRTKVRVPDAD